MSAHQNQHQTSSSTSAETASATRIGLFFAALFLVLGLHLPFFPIWLDWVGLSAGEIAVVTAMPLFLRLGFAPLLAIYADRHHAHRLAILALAIVALITVILLIVTRGFWPIFLVSLVFTLAVATMMPLVETIAVAGVKKHGHDYGRMRLWGSLAFISVGFVGGWLIDWQGAGITVPLLIAAAVAALLAGINLPKPPGQAFHTNDADRVSRARAMSDGDEVRRLASSGLFLVFLLACSAIQGAHGLFYTFGALHWKAQGLSTAWVGALWAIGVLAEVVLFAWSRAVVARFGAVMLIIAGGVAGILRWGVMSLDPGLAVLIPLQVLHGFTYGATHLGAIFFMAESVPERAAGTAQALYGACAAGVATGAATLASGPLYAALKGEGYLVMALIAGVGVVAALVLRARWPADLLWKDPATPGAKREAEIGPKLPVGPNL